MKVGPAFDETNSRLHGLWVAGELSYDRFHRDTDRIGMVLAHGSYLNNPSTPIVMAPVLEAEIPEAEELSLSAWLEELLGEDLLNKCPHCGQQTMVRQGQYDDFNFLQLLLISPVDQSQTK